MHRTLAHRTTARLAAPIAALSLFVASAQAQLIPTDLPDEIQGVKLIEHRGESVPTDIRLVDSLGNERTTGEFFDGDRPVILILAYYDCPLLCTLVLNRAQDALNDISWTLGKEYRMLTVSFDFTNTTEDAYSKQQEYLLGYRDIVPDVAWEFCTTDAESAKRLATAVGFHFKYIPETDEYSHPSVLTFLTPDGKINNYIENLIFDPRDVKLALIESAEGKQGSIFDRIQHYCFTFNDSEGTYTLQAMNVMKLGGGLTMLFIGSFVGVVAIVGMRRRAAQTNTTPDSPASGDALPANS